jgi:GNAT superfamily N-acetyltransferase
MFARPRPLRGFFIFMPSKAETHMPALTPCKVDYTTDVARIDLDRVHDWIATKSYWAGRIPRQVFDRAVRGSLCFGGIEKGTTVAFCRVITDRATFAYIADVFVDPNRRGRGLGKGLMGAVMAHPELKHLRRWLLVTADAHGLYAQHGFEALLTPERFMERCDPRVYERLAAEAASA